MAFKITHFLDAGAGGIMGVDGVRLGVGWVRLGQAGSCLGLVWARVGLGWAIVGLNENQNKLPWQPPTNQKSSHPAELYTRCRSLIPLSSHPRPCHTRIASSPPHNGNSIEVQ